MQGLGARSNPSTPQLRCALPTDGTDDDDDALHP